MTLHWLFYLCKVAAVSRQNKGEAEVSMVKRVKEACADLNNAGDLGLKGMAEGACSEIGRPSWEGMCNDRYDYEDSNGDDFPYYFQ